MLIRNANQRSKDYGDIKDAFRPGHADFTFQEKYGIRDYRGGGRSSGRETAARVAAGAVAKVFLATYGIKIHAYTIQIGDIQAKTIDLNEIENNSVRCPDKVAAAQMESLVITLRDEGDSIGGMIETIVVGCPTGLGDPVFDKLDAKQKEFHLAMASMLLQKKDLRTTMNLAQMAPRSISKQTMRAVCSAAFPTENLFSFGWPSNPHPLLVNPKTQSPSTKWQNQ
jgi:chorismate synthase